MLPSLCAPSAKETPANATSHATSDSIEADKLGRELPKVPKWLKAMRAFDEWAVSRAGQPFRVHRETLIRIVAGIGLGAWVFTLCSPPSGWVLVHYLGLAAVVVAITLEIAGPVPRLKPFGIPCAVVAVLVVWWGWHQYGEIYQVQWESNDGECLYHDTYRRGGAHIYRWMNNKRWDEFLEGAMSGKPPRLHGHWKTVSFLPYKHTDNWYWYGEEITQGEWELRNK